MSGQRVEIFVDPLCPWSWLTSRWLAEVATVRAIDIETKILSLAEINRKEDGTTSAAVGEAPLRLLIQARRTAGERGIRNLYTELGEAHHERGEPLDDPATMERAVAAAGLDGALVAEALADASTQAEVLAEHRAAVERGGFGVASLSVDGGPLFFGPVVDTRISGEEAGQLWDMVAPLLGDPRVFELKRNRTVRADVGRNRNPAAA